MQQPGSITFGTPLAPAAGATGTFGGFGSGLNQTPAFGATNTGLKFGATPTTSSNLFGGGLAAPANPTGGLSFGAPASTAPSTGFSFGSNTTQPTAGGLSFGAQAMTTTSGTSFSYGQTTTATTAPNTGLNFGSFNKPASTAQPLSFGLGSTSVAKAPSLVPGTTGSSLFTGGTGLFAKPATTTSTLTGINPIVNQQQQPLQAQPLQAQQRPINIGLGGVDTFQNKSGQIGATTKESDGKLTKEQQLPNEFLQLIDGFKNHIKQQKMFSSDVARGDIKPLRKIQEDIEHLRTQLAELGNSIGIVNRQQAEKLKYETAKCLSHAEMAQRIHDTPPGFQIDNTTPLHYFIETVHKFENDLSAIRQQIEATEKHIKSLERPKALSSQEMTLGLRRLHETFVALAGRLQSLHSQVEMQKTQYLNMRKYLFKDTMNVLFDQNQFTNKLNTTLGACTGSLNSINNALNRTNSNMSMIGSFTPPKRAAGPTPFSTLGKNTLSFISTSQQQSNNNDVTGGASPHVVGTNTNANQTSVSSTIPPPAYPSGSSTLNWGSNSGGGAIKTTQPPSYNASIGLTTNSSLFGSPAGSPSTDFQLQRPPSGNKRGFS